MTCKRGLKTNPVRMWVCRADCALGSDSGLQTFHRVEDSLETDSDFPFGGRSPLTESLSRTSLCRRKSTRGSSFTASDGIRDDTANFKQDQGKREEVSRTYIHSVSTVEFTEILNKEL